MPFSDLTLSRRLERAEGHASARFAEARRRLFPDSGAEWIECAGAYAVFDGADSPVTQTFGLAIFEPLTEASLEIMERFFGDRGAPVMHEVSPFAGAAAMDLLCRRNYRPCEISNVLYRSLEPVLAGPQRGVQVRAIGAQEGKVWADVSARGWAHEHPELRDFLLQLSDVCSAREDTVCFLAEADGILGAAGTLSLHAGVALLGGSATVPELRKRGLHGAMVEERLRHATACGCDLAMMVAEPGSNSQRNAERNGFRVAYTRTKWRLGP